MSDKFSNHQPPPNVHIHNYNGTQSATTLRSQPKNKWIALLLCFFVGYLGIHKFYEGRIGWGVLYLLTFGLLGLGVLIDLIVLVMKTETYYIEY